MGPENKVEFTGGTLYIISPSGRYQIMELMLSLIAAMLIGICITLVGIERDLREILDNMHKFEEEKEE